MSFSTLGLGPKILKAVEDAGYSVPTPIQLQAIPVILDRKDLIGIAQTGTGKTAAFALPMLELITRRELGSTKPYALIVAPTRELALQIDEAVRSLAKDLRLRCVTIYGGVGERPQIDALHKGADIIVATPGRLIDLFGQGHVSLKDIRYVVLDEADRMLDMGFLPQIRRIINALPKDRQTMLFSATLSRDIENIAHDFLRAPQVVEIGRRSNPAETVTHYLYPVSKARKVELLIHLLRDETLDSVLVFSRTKHGADKIARKLSLAKIPTTTIHSNRTQSQRVRALESFREAKVRVLVATDIAARGLDVEGISHVINFDFPMHPEDYVHRIGRTGRAEAEGDAISFITIEDGPAVRELEKMIGRPIERKKVEGFDYGEEATMSVFHRPADRPVSRPMPTGGRGNQQRTSRSRIW